MQFKLSWWRMNVLSNCLTFSTPQTKYHLWWSIDGIRITTVFHWYVTGTWTARGCHGKASVSFHILDCLLLLPCTPAESLFCKMEQMWRCHDLFDAQKTKWHNKNIEVHIRFFLFVCLFSFGGESCCACLGEFWTSESFTEDSKWLHACRHQMSLLRPS